ncbi:MAG: hypothetical protein CUN49_01850 [Candidatus Thermofonsia Clade 1 bacterium]|uniref:Protein kinase domain-containing protein n=1 Tax=Candidatus Thermofonsia Clade 1 bacterium TaxID=2364210 RepID=A0A2M8PHX1_9CHLR|nr:MAG: hypothetical protein CUN49_01850 [Candidatus Thermofonsia Clade 1 bacterium]RMF54068.1 MAG: hypothetical protein D6749_00525 [Chloroflexota bacterium]
MIDFAPTGLTQRYVLREELGRGGMGAVFRAYDRLRGEEVALKRLSAPIEALDFSSRGQGSSIAALANEFRLLSSLRHPSIIAVHDYGFDESGQPFYTMELLRSPQNILSFGASLSVDEKIRLILQVLEALSYLHRRSILHRDLAPNNLLFADGHLRVVDFGLSVLRGQRVGLAGTLPYLAPELLMDQPPSEASDLYTVGVIAHELLSGFNPFKAETVSQLLDNILHVTPDLSALEVNPAVQRLLERLLARDPADRAQDAAALLAEYFRAIDEPLPPQAVAVREGFLQTARFIGREAELAQLMAALEGTQRGQGALWLIGGESGVGKSRLVDELRIRALVSGVLVLRGQAVSGSGAFYQLWQGVLRELALHCAPSTFEASVLKPFVPGLEKLLGQPIADPPDLEPRKIRERFFSTVEALFSRLTRPTLVIAEDIHWAGQGSLQLLDRLSALAPHRPLLLVATYREEERPDLPEQLPRAQRMSLARLAPDQIARLTESMIGLTENTPAVLQLLQRESEGNPLFIIEVLRELAQHAERIDQIGLVTLPQRLFSGGIQTVLRRRLARLPERARDLLTLAAVAGRQLDMALISALRPAVDPSLDLERWLDVCANHAVLERMDEQWRFAHDKLRETLLASLSPDESAALSRQVAEAIERLYSEDAHHWEALAYHWANAGDRVKEAHYSALAGMQAVRRFAYKRAVPLLERALALAEQAGSSNLQKARLELHLGRAHEEISVRMQHYQRALSLLEQPFPQRERLTRPLIGAFARQFLLHRTLPPRFYRVSAQRAEQVHEAATIYQDVSGDCWNSQQLTAGAYAVMRALNLAETLPEPTVVLARAYIGATIGMSSVLGLHSLARFYGRRALECTEHIQDQETRAYVLNGIGIAAYYRGEPSAEQLFADAAGLYRAIGDRDTCAVAFLNAAIAACVFGNWRDCLAYLAQFDVQWLRVKLMRYRSPYYRIQALLRLGESAQAEALMAEINLPDDLSDPEMDYTPALALLIMRYRLQGDLENAVRWLERALRHPRAMHADEEVFLDAALDLLACLPESARAPYWSALAPILNSVRRLARSRLILRPEYYRLYGLQQWLCGHQQAARKAWQKGIAYAEKRGLRVQLWALCKTYGEQSGDERLLERAERLLIALRAQAPRASLPLSAP